VAFVGQLRIARDLQMPIQLHLRSHITDTAYMADAHALDILREHNMVDHPMQRHCFMGDVDAAKKCARTRKSKFQE
jgi:Tat protein secretion system quality control protein TatD with DNase activity